MASRASDIAADLRTAVPPQFQPSSDQAGALSRGFAAAGLSDRDRFNQGMGFLGALADGIEAASPSFILPGSLAAIRERQIAHRLAEQRKDERFAYDQAKAALEARLAEIDAEIAGIDKRIGEINARREVIADQMDALHDIEQIRRSGGKLDPRNAAHRRLLERSGISAADANGDDFARVIADRRRDLDREDGALDIEWNRHMRRREVVVGERIGVVGALDEIQRADTGEARLLAQRRAETVLGSRQVATAAYISASLEARRIAADAVGESEAPEHRAASLALNRKAVEGGATSVFQDSEADFELPGTARAPKPGAPG